VQSRAGEPPRHATDLMDSIAGPILNGARLRKIDHHAGLNFRGDTIYIQGPQLPPTQRGLDAIALRSGRMNHVHMLHAPVTGNYNTNRDGRKTRTYGRWIDSGQQMVRVRVAADAHGINLCSFRVVSRAEVVQAERESRKKLGTLGSQV
jgi:hypothetical protein